MNITGTKRYTVAAMCGAAGIVMGAAIANGSSVVIGGLLIIPIVAALQRWCQAGAIGFLLSGLLAGNIVGNRGFAQILLSDRIPLLPAEAALALGGAWLIFEGSRRQRLPWPATALGCSVLCWFALCSLRMPMDLRSHGFWAVRDFATVYYSGFFFITARAARIAPVRSWLHGTFAGAVVALAVIFPFYQRFEFEFLTSFTFRGGPLIAIKGDLAGTFAAAGAMYAAVMLNGARNRIAWSLALLTSLGLAIYLVPRAAYVGVLVAVIFFMRGSRINVVKGLTLIVAAGLASALVYSVTSNGSWRDTRLNDVYEHVISLTDFSGSRVYTGEESQDTGDNTRFRLAWWHLLIERTLAQNPFFGAGFGADISSEFSKDYFGITVSDFTARSPHNILLTVFGRSGFVGLVPFLAIIAALCLEARRAASRAPLSHEELKTSALYPAVIVILVSSCFGVVLEGPMGAVVFWTLAGLAHGSSAPDLIDHGPTAMKSAETHDPSLQTESEPAIR
ncbi:hypothetical protein MASR2M8_25420 [Opitutaceae bacterium]